MKLALPKVHWSVNVAGLAAGLGSAAGFVLSNQGCVSSALPTKDALAATAVAGVIAAFLPVKPKSSGP